MRRFHESCLYFTNLENGLFVAYFYLDGYLRYFDSQKKISFEEIKQAENLVKTRFVKAFDEQIKNLVHQMSTTNPRSTDPKKITRCTQQI